jgi:hypothetical protein
VSDSFPSGGRLAAGAGRGPAGIDADGSCRTEVPASAAKFNWDRFCS